MKHEYSQLELFYYLYSPDSQPFRNQGASGRVGDLQENFSKKYYFWHK